MNDPQPEGSHGKPHRTTKILSDARRRGGVAARSAGAAGRDAGDRIPEWTIGAGVRSHGSLFTASPDGYTENLRLIGQSPQLATGADL